MGVAPFVFAATAAGSAAAFVLLARAVEARDTAAIDRAVRESTVADPDAPIREVAESIAPAGKWWTYVPVATVAAAAVALRETPTRWSGAATLIGAAVTSALVNEAIDDYVPQPPAPPGRPSITHPVFPSGHAMGTAVVALTLSWIGVREEMLRPVAVPLMLALPIVSSMARMAEDKHWVTDVAGGYLGALVIAAAALALYETHVAVAAARE